MTNAQKCIEVVECKIIPLTSSKYCLFYFCFLLRELTILDEGTCSSIAFTSANNISTALKSDSRIAEEVINTPSTSGMYFQFSVLLGCYKQGVKLF